MMKERNIDALFLSSKENVFYFTGYRKTQIGKSRGRYLILPNVGSPTLIIPQTESSKAEETSWLYPNGVTTCDSKNVNKCVVEIIKKHRAQEKSVGIEWNGLWAPMRTEMSISDYEEIKNKLPKAKLVDVGELLWKMRMIKSTREIEYLKKACQITFESLKVALESIHEGVTEQQLLKIFCLEMIKRGGFDDPLNAFCHIKSGLERSRIYDPRPMDKKVQRGDIVQFDCGAIIKGYFADMIRQCCVRPSKKQQEMFNVINKAFEKAYEMLEPGTQIKEMVSTTVNVIKKAGYEPRLGIGHGIGLDIHEPPIFRLTNESFIQEGMVIAIEPAFYTNEGGFTQEDNILITKKGPLNLTPIEKKLQW
ncbi:MAG: aminopeptidase P family protein [Candidatus Bathyarchaeota archaeon]|nr:MAG: aminopeptidase P family protein [Candidatus Bathyarchaeota archaeon]